MADNRNICEEIEIAIYSDAELTEEQKNHIENCESCRTLLSQVSSMKADLGGLTVPNLEEGAVANAVMSEIRNQKTSVSFPKFKITHHLGTAAAVVIILVAALMIKNPSDTNGFTANDAESNNEMVFSAPENNHVLSSTADTALTEESVGESTEAAVGDTEESETGNSKYTLYFKSAETEEPASQTELGSQYADSALLSDGTYNAPESTGTKAEAESTDANDGEENKAIRFASPASGSSSYEYAAKDYTADDKISDADSGTAVTTEEAADGTWQVSTDEAKEESEDTAASGGGAANSVMMQSSASAIYIFEGIELLDGEESFDYNISVINQRLYELYGGEYVLSREKLINLGVDNAKLLELSPTVTDKMFDSYKEIFDIFE